MNANTESQHLHNVAHNVEHAEHKVDAAGAENTVSAEQTQAKKEDKPTFNFPNPDKFHQSVEMHFGFRTTEDEKTGVKTKREAVDIKLPVLNFDGVAKILTDYANTFQNLESENAELKAAAVAAKKSYDLLMSAVQGTYEAFIKDMLGDAADITSANFPYDKVTWEEIANQPESERRGRGIAKEVWDDFIKSYISVMPAATGKKKEAIEKQAAIFGQKLNPLRNHEDKEKILPKLMEQLTIYMNAAGEDSENFAGCVKFLMEKSDKILNADKQANLAANLGFD